MIRLLGAMTGSALAVALFFEQIERLLGRSEALLPQRLQALDGAVNALPALFQVRDAPLDGVFIFAVILFALRWFFTIVFNGLAICFAIATVLVASAAAATNSSSSSTVISSPYFGKLWQV